MRTLGFDKIVGSDFEQSRLAALASKGRRAGIARSNPSSPASIEALHQAGLFYFLALWSLSKVQNFKEVFLV